MLGGVAVHRHLLDLAIPHEFFTSTRLHRPEDMPGVLGVPPEDCVRTVLLETAGGPVAAVASLALELDPSLCAEASGEADVRRAPPGAVSAVTGYPADWVPPAAFARSVRTLVDKALPAREVLYAPGGQPQLVLKLRGEDLLRATGGTGATLGSPATIEA